MGLLLKLTVSVLNSVLEDDARIILTILFQNLSKARLSRRICIMHRPIGFGKYIYSKT